MRTPDIFKTKHSRPVLSREERTLRALETAFPSGEWVEIGGAQEPVDRVPDGGSGESPVALDDVAEAERISDERQVAGCSLTIIGGTKYDEDEFEFHMNQLPDDMRVITGDGRGAEKASTGYHRGTIRYTIIEPDPDVYGKNARKVNVEQVLSYDPFSPLLLVGSGERVKQAEAWLKRANWPREVHRIG